MTGFASKRARSRDFEKDIIESMSNEMARKIDKELLDDLMIDVLKDEGWIATKVNPAFTDMGMLSGKFEDWYVRTGEWVQKYAQGEYRLIKGQWLFKDPRDATMFILKWT